MANPMWELAALPLLIANYALAENPEHEICFSRVCLADFYFYFLLDGSSSIPSVVFISS